MNETEAASWHRERKAKRERVCRVGNNLVSISYLMFVADVVYVAVVFIVLFPKEDENVQFYRHMQQTLSSGLSF